ncbi:MAG: phosphonoacetaldehyde hydrolase [Clostridiales bacterium]|nr:phosphonoacetaldehyde hydrolase [Clostridiales bacterium]
MRGHKIEAVIFDWAGTTVDYGCFAPVNAFNEAFKKFSISPTVKEIREPMGLLKIDHIRTMLNMNRISGLWKEIYGRPFTEDDVYNIYGEFESSLFESLACFAKPKKGVCETVEKLRSKGIKIGSTTGYTDRMMKIVTAEAEKNGYAPDLCITPDMTEGFGRPYPYMIFENMKRLEIMSTGSVIKVGDTVSDIKEGKNAGVWTVGVIEGSSESGLTEGEFSLLSESEKKQLAQKVENKFSSNGADFVISNINEICDIIDKVNLSGND